MAKFTTFRDKALVFTFTPAPFGDLLVVAAAAKRALMLGDIYEVHMTPGNFKLARFVNDEMNFEDAIAETEWALGFAAQDGKIEHDFVDWDQLR